MGKPIPGRKNTLGSLRGDKTGKTSKKWSKNMDFWSFFEFCRPGVSPKYSYAPESVCPRFSDEFLKKMDHQNVKIADFTIKAHFWASSHFGCECIFLGFSAHFVPQMEFWQTINKNMEKVPENTFEPWTSTWGAFRKASRWSKLMSNVKLRYTYKGPAILFLSSIQ